MKGLDALDWVVIVAYFLILLGVAWWVIRQNKKTPKTIFWRGGTSAGSWSGPPFLPPILVRST